MTEKASSLKNEHLNIIQSASAQRHKAIIIYIVAENEDPHQNLIRLLREMAASGYLCFLFLPSNSGSIDIREKNLILLHQGSSLIPAFRTLSAVVLSTRDIHPDWTAILHHKILWLHIAPDSPEQIRNNINKNADIISYFPTGVEKVDRRFYDDINLELRPAEEMQANIALLEQKIRSNPRGWQLYANLDLRGKVAVMACTFLDFNGEFFYNGGAERYLLDLAEICRELNSELVVFQYGNYPWMRRVKHTDIISLSRCGIKAEGFILRCAKEFNQVFHEQVHGTAPLSIYSPFYEAWPLAASPSIGISHGVSWDNPYNDFENAAQFWVMNQRYVEGAKACEDLVSVDTNSANWLQTVDFKLGQRTKVIPNYVDLLVFKPKADYLEEKNKVVILYPRQLYSARGLYLVLEIMDEILEQYPEVEFHFVGRGSEEDINNVADRQSKWPGRVKHYSLSMDEMPQAYQAADISLIPSIHSEGTSLSCLEAMACGNAVIATRIGGLPDLIIHNYNGFLIDPRSEELRDAIIKLLKNREQLNLFKKRNCEVAQAFSKVLWRDRWITLLKNKMDTTNPTELAESLVVQIQLGKGLVDYDSLGRLVISLLTEGCLVYVRSPAAPDPQLSFARIQWLGPGAPIYSHCDVTLEWKG